VKTIVLIVIIAIGVAVSWRARRERAANETEMASISKEHEASRRKIAAERRRLQLAQDARASLAAPSPGEAAGTAPSGSRKLSPEAALASNPALLAEYLRYQHEVPDWSRGHMFRVVGFSPGQIEQWKQMTVQDVQRRLDLIAAVETQGLGRNSDTFKALSAENQRRRREKEVEILDDLEPRYREYQRLEGVRGLVEWLTRTGVYQDETITGEQLERATRIIAANTGQVLRSGSGGEIPIIDWTAATVQLKDTLSPSQIATLQRLGQQFETIVRASQRVEERTKLLTAQFQSRPKP
jgi:hypothetical protein